MSEPLSFLPSGELAEQAASRIAGHARRLRTTWPSLLADHKFLAERREESPSGPWPQWCRLPMNGTVAALNNSGRPYVPTDIAFGAAVGQWRLTERYIMAPSADVAAAAVPGRAGGDPAAMERLPREGLLEELAGSCYYLVMPRQAGGKLREADE